MVLRLLPRGGYQIWTGRTGGTGFLADPGFRHRAAEATGLSEAPDTSPPPMTRATPGA
jgi:hypothetical protein